MYLRILLLSCIAYSAGVHSQPAAAPVTMEWAEGRMHELRALSADRTNPERALQSFFRYLNDSQEMHCIQEALRFNSRGKRPEDLIGNEQEQIRDEFFSGTPLIDMHQFDYLAGGLPFETCMSTRQTFGYEIRGVEPLGSNRSRFLVIAKNTTPLSSDMKPTEDDLKKRAEGTLFRFTFDRSDGWKITRIEEHWDFADSDEWHDVFSKDTSPLVPSDVMLKILL